MDLSHKLKTLIKKNEMITEPIEIHQVNSNKAFVVGLTLYAQLNATNLMRYLLIFNR